VLVAVVSVVVAIAVAAAARPVEVWNGQIRVVFLAPSSSLRNPYGLTSLSLVDMAGLVARDVEGFTSTPQTVDSFVTLASQGTTAGFQVRQHNLGGQWESFYEDPAVDIQSTGTTAAIAGSQMQAGIDAVLRALDDLQNRESVPTERRIRTQLSPQSPVFTIQRGSRIRAVAATALVGGLFAVGVVALVERRSRSRGAVRPSEQSQVRHRA
jgi:hypothetical protein